MDLEKLWNAWQRRGFGKSAFSRSQRYQDVRKAENSDFQTFSKHFLGRIARYQWVNTEKAWNRVFRVVSVQWNPLPPPFFDASAKDATEKPECPDNISDKENRALRPPPAGEGVARRAPS
jgi:hypothetical protein